MNELAILAAAVVGIFAMVVGGILAFGAFAWCLGHWYTAIPLVLIAIAGYAKE